MRVEGCWFATRVHTGTPNVVCMSMWEKTSGFLKRPLGGVGCAVSLGDARGDWDPPTCPWPNRRAPRACAQAVPQTMHTVLESPRPAWAASARCMPDAGACCSRAGGHCVQLRQSCLCRQLFGEPMLGHIGLYGA